MRMVRNLVLILLVISGAGCSLDRQFVGAVDGYAKTLLPEYETYVKDDPALSEDSRRIRLQTAERFRKLLEEAREDE